MLAFLNCLLNSSRTIAPASTMAKSKDHMRDKAITYPLWLFGHHQVNKMKRQKQSHLWRIDQWKFNFKHKENEVFF